MSDYDMVREGITLLADVTWQYAPYVASFYIVSWPARSVFGHFHFVAE